MNIFSFFNKPKQIKENTDTKVDTFLDIIISLNKNYEIDLSLFVDCNYDKYGIDIVDYILMCFKIINFDHIKVKNELIDILKHQIKNKENEYFVNNLVFLLEEELKKKKQEIETNTSLFIKPSQVFTKHIHEHQ